MTARIRRPRQVLGLRAIHVLATLIGVLAFLYPLWVPVAPMLEPDAAHATDAPLVLAVLVAACFVALALEAGGGLGIEASGEHSALGARAIAVLGVLVAINSVLRFIEVVLPGPGGFTPIFVLILLTGYVYGARFGFLMGALTLAVSAVLTGGIGPWLPYQMLGAGWAGMTAGWLPHPGTLTARVGDPSRGRTDSGAESKRTLRGEVIALAAFGALWGLLFGLIMTLWFWPFLDAGARSAEAAGIPARVLRFLTFYGVTSFVWDLFGAVGNALLILAIGRPLLTALRRSGRWFRFERMDGPWFEHGHPVGLPPLVEPGPLIEHGPLIEGRPLNQRWHPTKPGPRHPSTPTMAATATPGLALARARESAWRSLRAFLALPLLADAVHPHAWLSWLFAVLALASQTRHPWILAGLGLATALVYAALPQPVGLAGTVRIPFARFAVLFIPCAAIYNFLMAHSGQTVVWRLPGSWPLIGGPLTLEALVFGALTGLALLLLFSACATVQRALSSRDLIRLVPRAFGPLTMVAGIALTYVPSTLAQLGAIRDALALRGHRWRGWRDWGMLAMPLFTGGLERALDLAESMTARGLAPADGTGVAAGRGGEFGPGSDSDPVGRSAQLVGLGLTAILVGWVAPLGGWLPAWLGSLVLALGLGALVLTLVVLGRRAPFTAFRTHAWHASDVLVAVAGWAPLLVRQLDPDARSALAYTPYPQLAWPNLDTWLAVSLLGLSGPGLVLAMAQARAVRRRGMGASAAVSVRDEAGRPEVRDATVEDATDSPNAAVAYQQFSFRYPPTMDSADTASAYALHDLDLFIPAGGLTLVAGPSGAGKSTLLRAINGLVPHFSGGQVAGAVEVWIQSANRAEAHLPVETAGPPGARGRLPLDPIQLGPGAMSRYVGFVSGDPERAFVLDVVADEVALALEHQGIELAEMRARVADALSRVGLAGMADRPMATLSGGERQRVAIAAALALRPQVLVLDEPTSQLDDAAADTVLDALAELAERHDLTLIVSEHRLERVAPRARHVVYLPGPGAQPVVGAPEDVLPRLPQWDAPLPPATAFGTEVLAMEEVGFAYEANDDEVGSGSDRTAPPPERRRPILDGISLTVRAGEIVALTGPSGVGKTTLLKLAVGLLQPTHGTVRLEGVPIAGRSVAEVCCRVGVLPQDPGALLLAETVRDELLLTLANHGLAPTGVYDPDDLLARLGLAELAARYPRDLSTGQRQRVALGAVTITRPALLLLDEPTRGLDGKAIAELAGLLHAHAREGAAILVATHDRRLVRAVHRVVRLGGGGATYVQLAGNDPS